MIAVLTYLACIALWALSTILMIWKKFPWCALFLFLSTSGSSSPSA